MSGIVKNIIELEAEADTVIERARAEAKKMESAVRDEISSHQDRVNKELDAKVAAYHDDARGRHARDMEDAKRQLEEALVALSSISEHTIQVQVDRILEHYRNL